MNVLTQFENRDMWKAWGLNSLREQGGAILLEGPPGTGKTSIAKWISVKLKRGFRTLELSKCGGGEPGATEKGVITFFEGCAAKGNCTIFIDECNNLLRDRATITGDAITWMIGLTEAIMLQVAKYAGLVILATNHAKDIDRKSVV